MVKHIGLVGALVIGVLVLPSCNQRRNEVNIYSHRHYPSDDKLFADFTAKTGIQVNVVKATADQLIERLEQEGENTPADLLITIDAGRLYRAKEKGLLQQVNSAKLDSNLDKTLCDKDHYWYGLTYRARVIAYNKQKVDAKDLPTYFSLTEDKWLGKILVQSSENLYNQSLLASIIAHEGADKSTEWAKDVTKNMAHPPQGNDVNQVEGVEAGVADLAIVNSYYVARLINSEQADVREKTKQIGVIFPNQNSYGTHINISGVALVKHSHHTENAVKLMEYLSEVQAQNDFTNVNYEYPANPKVQPNKTLIDFGPFKKDTLNLSQLGVFNTQAVKIFDQAGWK